MVGVFVPDTNAKIKYIWQGSAISGLLAFAVESWLAKLGQTENKRLRSDLDAANSKVAEAQSRLDAQAQELSAQRQNLSPRKLSIFGLRDRLNAIWPRVPVRIAELSASREISSLAFQLRAFLSGAGWDVDRVKWNGGYVSGVTIFVRGGALLSGPHIAASIALEEMLIDYGIGVNHDTSPSVPEGQILIVIGPKEPTSDSADRRLPPIEELIPNRPLHDR